MTFSEQLRAAEARRKEKTKLFKKYKITSKQWGGDDGYQHTVFINGRQFVNGLTRSEVFYYKEKALESIISKESIEKLITPETANKE